MPRESDGQESVCKAESVGRQACKGEAASIWTLGMHGRSRDAHLKLRDPLLAITCALQQIVKHCCTTSMQQKLDSPAVPVGGVYEHGRLCSDGRAQTRAYARAQRRASTNGREPSECGSATRDALIGILGGAGSLLFGPLFVGPPDPPWETPASSFRY